MRHQGLRRRRKGNAFLSSAGHVDRDRVSRPSAPERRHWSTASTKSVIAEGGRIYLTKDAFTRPEHFRAMEPRLDAFNAVRRQWDPQVRIRSAQSVRLLGDPA